MEGKKSAHASFFRPDLLKGKVALITGGSRGGMLQATAEAFLRHGCKVAMVARSKERLEKVMKELSAFGECMPIASDVRKEEDVKRAVKSTLEAYG